MVSASFTAAQSGRHAHGDPTHLQPDRDRRRRRPDRGAGLSGRRGAAGAAGAASARRRLHGGSRRRAPGRGLARRGGRRCHLGRLPGRRRASVPRRGRSDVRPALAPARPSHPLGGAGLEAVRGRRGGGRQPGRRPGHDGARPARPAAGRADPAVAHARRRHGHLFDPRRRCGAGRAASGPMAGHLSRRARQGRPPLCGAGLRHPPAWLAAGPGADHARRRDAGRGARLCPPAASRPGSRCMSGRWRRGTGRTRWPDPPTRIGPPPCGPISPISLPP